MSAEKALKDAGEKDLWSFLDDLYVNLCRIFVSKER